MSRQNLGPAPLVGPLVLPVLLGLLVLLAAPTGALAQTDGRIDGTVLHGGDEAPVTDLEVVLVGRAGEEETELEAVRTDDDGRFAFGDVATDADHLEVVTTYADAEYRSGALTIEAGGAAVVDLEVFESTDDAEEVVIASWVVWVDRTDGAAIQQDLQVDNRGERTYLGEDADVAGNRAVLAVRLPPGASGLRFLGRFTECCATMRGTDYVYTSPLPPGPTAGTLRFSVGSLDTLTLPAPLPVESFTMMVPTGVGVGTDQLELAGEMVSQGNTYDVYTAEDLARGDVVEVSFRGLAVTTTPTWQLAAAVAAALLAAVTAVIWQRRRRPPPTSPAAPRTAPAAAAAAGPAPLEPLRLSAQQMVEELALLDVGFERGLISREVYEPLRQARKAELLAVTGRTEG
jgi:hypothetical protein